MAVGVASTEIYGGYAEKLIYQRCSRSLEEQMAVG